MDFGLEASSRGNTYVVRVRGDVDVSTVGALEECLQRGLSDGGREIAIDLEECAYLDSEGIKVLIRVFHALDSHGQLIICGAVGSVQRVLQISGLDQVVRMLASVSDLS